MTTEGFSQRERAIARFAGRVGVSYPEMLSIFDDLTAWEVIAIHGILTVQFENVALAYEEIQNHQQERTS
jgi:hypothetical protein